MSLFKKVELTDSERRYVIIGWMLGVFSLLAVMIIQSLIEMVV